MRRPATPNGGAEGEREEASSERPHPCEKQSRKDGPPRMSHRIEGRPPADGRYAFTPCLFYSCVRSDWKRTTDFNT